MNHGIHTMPLRWLTLCLASLLAACGAGRPASEPPLPQAKIAHGPFEVLAGTRRISTGTFPNQGGSPFATQAVSEFRVTWRGKPVVSPGGNDRFWHVLRLEGAPQPALLLVTTGFVLATEEAGQLKLQALKTASNALAEAQWLDSEGGQPGPVQFFGISAVQDLEAGTRLAGGRWLRLGSALIVDVPAFTFHAVAPWVPLKPGEPATSLSRDGDEVHVFSPRRSQYVLRASGYDYARQGTPRAFGLMVVDIASGTGYELRVDRRRFRFGELDSLTPAWIDHHFVWQADAQGRERLVPRPAFAPWPWRGRLHETSAGRWQYDVPRIDAPFLAEARRVAAGVPGVQIGTVDPDGGFSFTGSGCPLRAQAFGRGGDADDRRLAIWIESTPTPSPPSCEAAMRQLATAIDRELATGRHDALVQLQD